MSIPGELKTSTRLLMGPGPSDVHPRVLRSMATPLLGHLDPQFIEVMNDIQAMLRTLFRTDNEMTLAISGPGTAGMECCLVNLLEPGDEAVVCVHGVFGARLAEIAERAGAKVIRVEAPWGEATDPAKVEEALHGRRPKLVAVVQGETSTGVLQPLEELARLARGAGALFLVDAVACCGGAPLEMDAWGIDALYTGSQKCLSAPPGLSPVSFSPRAVRVIEERSTAVRSWSLDIGLLRGYWVGGAKRAYHHTAPVSGCFALREALRMVLEEGLEARFARHQRCHELLRDALVDLGFEFLVAPELRMPMLNAVRLPPGLDDGGTRNRLLEEYNIEVGAGLGAFAGKIWRVGLMGESASVNHIHVLVAALKQIMK